MCLESFCDEIIYYPEIVVDNVHFWTKTDTNGFYSKIKSKLVLVVPLVLVLKVLIIDSPGATSYNGLNGDAKPERGTFFRPEIWERGHFF